MVPEDTVMQLPRGKLYKLEIQKLLGPNLDFVRLAVTAEQASVLDLIEWKSMCVQGTDA